MMPSSAVDAAVVVKEMGLTPSIFDRTLQQAVGARQIERLDAGYVIVDPAGPQRVLVELSPQPDRCIASICLPVTRVTLRFDGFSASEQAEFLRRFDLYFQKGGG